MSVVAVGRKESMANAYGNLGLVYGERGDLDKAEEMYLKSLEIEEALGRKEGMASQYGNLGLVYQVRDDLDQAEEVFLKSLALFEKLGSKPMIEKAKALIDQLEEAKREQ